MNTPSVLRGNSANYLLNLASQSFTFAASQIKSSRINAANLGLLALLSPIVPAGCSYTGDTWESGQLAFTSDKSLCTTQDTSYLDGLSLAEGISDRIFADSTCQMIEAARNTGDYSSIDSLATFVPYALLNLMPVPNLADNPSFSSDSIGNYYINPQTGDVCKFMAITEESVDEIYEGEEDKAALSDCSISRTVSFACKISESQYGTYMFMRAYSGSESNGLGYSAWKIVVTPEVTNLSERFVIVDASVSSECLDMINRTTIYTY